MKSWRKLSITALGLALIGFGAWAFWQQYQATHDPNPTVSTEVVTHSTDEPDETPPKECPEVPADIPREIELPSLSVSGCIQRVGVDQENKIAVPTNIHVAGWFVDSVLPGEEGVSIIDGHVQGYYKEGIFKRLSELNPNDKIMIEFGDGARREFAVASVNNYSVKQASQEQFKRLDGVENQLTMITCGGNFNRDSQQYDKRFLVRAEFID